MGLRALGGIVRFPYGVTFVGVKLSSSPVPRTHVRRFPADPRWCLSSDPRRGRLRLFLFNDPFGQRFSDLIDLKGQTLGFGRTDTFLGGFGRFLLG